MSDPITTIHPGFRCVYLLCSQSSIPRFRAKCYVGYTVNPLRRLKQHNAGCEFGGARKTNNKGPWKMVMIVYGFPNNISALQFEWAWQNPKASLRLKSFVELQARAYKESWFAYHFRILNQMLLVPPWNRLPLTIQWLETDYQCNFPNTSTPPEQMKITVGKIETVQKERKTKNADPLCIIWAPECHLCLKRIEQPEESRIGCLNPLCKLTCHITCLGNFLLTENKENMGHYIPIKGECPLCEMQWTWMALIEHRRNLNGLNVEELEEEEEVEDMPLLSSDDETDIIVVP